MAEHREEEVSELRERVRRLEEELRGVHRRLDEVVSGPRRLRRAGAAALLLAVVLSAGGAALIGDRVSRLDVVGPNNDPRVALSVNPENGSAGLEVLGLNGRRVIFLGTSATGIPNLAIYDVSGQQIVREVAP